MTYLITGGVRSGKSGYAEVLAKHLSDEVLYIATLEPSDQEMKSRIAKHQSRRPKHWRTLETKFSLAQSIQESVEKVILVDCLSGFVSNLVLEHEHSGEETVIEKVLQAISELTDVLRHTDKTIILVTNEVGYGVVPPYPLGRWFRDALGLANQRIAKVADAVALVTVGIPQTLKGTFPDVTF
jgi:adenosyl cobinamide kinase/adenosyl cobinamide phosphate guanylyltransferase